VLQRTSNGLIGEDGVGLAQRRVGHVLRKLSGGASVSRFNELGNGELGCPVDADEAIAHSGVIRSRIPI